MSELSIIEKRLKGVFLDYFRWYKKAEAKFEKFVVLMQVGDFYEIYGYEMENFKLGNIREIQKVLNFHVGKKSGTQPYSCPLMAGFPNYTLEKFTNILKQNYYVIYVINQRDNCICNHKKCKCKKLRDEAIIISPGTNSNPMEEDNNFLCSIYLERYSSKGKSIKVAGISFIDISTGKSYINQFEDNSEDLDNAFSQTIKTITATNPKEIIIFNKNLDMGKEELIQSLEISGNVYVRYFDNLKEKRLFDIGYQDVYLTNIFKTQMGMLNVIDYLGIGIKTESRNSFMLLLHIIENYQPQLINNIEKPVLDFLQERMILDNTTVRQLDILSRDENSNFRIKKYTSIFNVINFTKTNIGHRYLKHRITNPEMNVDIINFRYNLAEELLINQTYEKLEDILQKLPDFERIHRKINLQTIKLKDFCILDKGYKSFLDFYGVNDAILLKKFINENVTKKDLSTYIKDYKKVFNISHMNNDSFGVKNNIFKKKIHIDLDELFVKRVVGMKLFDIVQQEFNKFFRKNLTSVRPKDVFVKIKELKNSKYLEMTEHKYKKLMEHKEALNEWSFQISEINYNLKDFILEKKAKNYKICHPDLDYSTIEELDVEIYNLTKKYFLETMETYFKKYHKLYKNLIKITGEIDFSFSNAKCADKNNYSKPIIEQKEEAYFEIETMRHPLIEKLCIDKFKPFDLTLNSDKIGLILSGINGTGKSSLMKTVGILVTMAQAGYYVPCKKMKFGVFNKIMTRIVGNDNILTNSSSYQVEMKELRSILNRADKNSLILVDELCRGTEHTSSVSLTTATIQEFSLEIKNKFIITTHLHKIFSYIEDLDNVLIKHISIKEENGKLIYDRELKDGCSPTNYGLLVAKMMNIHPRVLARANKIRKDLLSLQSEVLSTKRSRYNKNLFMHACEVCETAENLHTHHIREQNEADENGFFDDGSHKNHISNLQVLCRDCHEEHHRHH